MNNSKMCFFFWFCYFPVEMEWVYPGSIREKVKGFEGEEIGREDTKVFVKLKSG